MITLQLQRKEDYALFISYSNSYVYVVSSSRFALKYFALPAVGNLLQSTVFAEERFWQILFPNTFSKSSLSGPHPFGPILRHEQ